MNRLAIGMMVKNESHIIERVLKSILPVADLVVITDTGSSDDTILKAGMFLQKHNIKYKIYFEQFTNFAANRNLVLQRVKETGEADYCLMIDADEELQLDPDIDINKFKESLKYLIYNVTMHSGLTSYYLPRLTSINMTGQYVGVTHEYLSSKDLLAGQYSVSIFQHVDSQRRKSNQKLSNDIELLEEAIKDCEPDLKARYAFYLAQTYFATENYSRSIHYYKLRIELGGWEQEIFYSHYQLGNIYAKINPDNIEPAMRHFLLAYEACPTRIESLSALKRIFDAKGYNNLSDKMLLPLLKTIKGPTEGLFVEDYQYYAWR